LAFANGKKIFQLGISQLMASVTDSGNFLAEDFQTLSPCTKMHVGLHVQNPLLLCSILTKTKMAQ
jgi:hypothetical protein